MRWRTRQFVDQLRRRFRPPVFLHLRGRWREPFVTSAVGVPHDAADQGAADAVRFGDFGQRHAALAITNDGGAIDVELASADLPAFEFGAAHAGTHSFDNVGYSPRT